MSSLMRALAASVRRLGARPLVATILLCPAIVSCSGDGPSEPSDDPPDNDDSPDVQLVTLEVTARLDSEFQQIGEELGWEDGTVPGALVTVRRFGSQSVDTAEADADGRAVFQELLEGNYTISAIRRLQPSEQELLSEANGGISVLGGATSTQLQPSSEERTLEIRAGRRGSIVISEVYSFVINQPGGAYQYAHYMELYNNADTTVYLDGLLVGNAWDRAVNGGDWPCTDFDHVRLDPDGLWASHIFRIPGTGTSYPLRSGEAAVLATDAINHSEFVDEGPDLSAADFEFIGRSDVDNPSVPNLTSVGPEIDNVNHGVVFTPIEAVPFVARPVDLEGLPRETVTIQTDHVYARLPTGVLIDIGQFVWFGRTFPFCDQLVHPSLDQAIGEMPSNEFMSIQRRVLFEMGDGRAVLQDTNTSARDFELASRTPGTIGG